MNAGAQMDSSCLRQRGTRQSGICAGLLRQKCVSWVATTKGIDAGLVGDLMMQAVEKRFGSNGKPPKRLSG
jgi:hypothetical protein